MPSQTLTTRVPQTGDTVNDLIARQGAVPFRPSLLVSAARSATTSTATLAWAGFRYALVFLNVTSVSGTGSLRAQVSYLDPVSGVWMPLAWLGPAITAAGAYVFALNLHGGVSGATFQGNAAGVPLSSQMRVDIVHGDASSYTYSLGADLA